MVSILSTKQQHCFKCPTVILTSPAPSSSSSDSDTQSSPAVAFKTDNQP